LQPDIQVFGQQFSVFCVKIVQVILCHGRKVGSGLKVGYS
jgi:hypothetical protein